MKYFSKMGQKTRISQKSFLSSICSRFIFLVTIKKTNDSLFNYMKRKSSTKNYIFTEKRIIFIVKNIFSKKIFKKNIFTVEKYIF